MCPKPRQGLCGFYLCGEYRQIADTTWLCWPVSAQRVFSSQRYSPGICPRASPRVILSRRSTASDAGSGHPAVSDIKNLASMPLPGACVAAATSPRRCRASKRHRLYAPAKPSQQNKHHAVHHHHADKTERTQPRMMVETDALIKQRGNGIRHV